MKKLLLPIILFLMYENFSLSLRGMEQQQNTHQDFYEIECKDNKKLRISSEQFSLLQENSTTIKDLLSCALPDRSANIIPLLNLDKEIMSQLLTLLSQPFVSFSSKKYEIYIDQLSQKPLTLLIQLFNAAFYLDLEKIVSFLAKTIAHKIVQGITHQQQSLLKKIFNNVSYQEKIIAYLKNNNHELTMIPTELKSIIAQHILYRNPTATLCSTPLKSMDISLISYGKITTFTWHPQKYILAFALDSGSTGTYIAIMQLADHSKQHPFIRLPTHGISKLALSFENKLAIFSTENTYVWEYDTNNLLTIPHIFTSTITTSMWNPNQTKFAVGSEDGTLYIFEQNSNNEWSSSPPLTGHFEYITHLQWDKTSLLSLDRNGKIIRWQQDLNKKWLLQSSHTAKQKYKQSNHLHPTFDLAAYPGHASDKRAVCLKFKKQKECTLLHSHRAKINQVSWNSTGDLLACASDQEISFWIPLIYYFPQFFNPEEPKSKPLTIEQALLILDWYSSHLDKRDFKILKELCSEYEELPDSIKTFLNDKNAVSIIKD